MSRKKSAATSRPRDGGASPATKSREAGRKTEPKTRPGGPGWLADALSPGGFLVVLLLITFAWHAWQLP